MSKELLNEVSRIREMMTFLNNGKNLLNESGALRVITGFGRRLAQNSIDDMVRLYGDEVGDILNKIIRLADDDLDGLFKNINDLKYVDDEAAKMFRADLRAVLPEEVNSSLTRLKDFLEENIADIDDIDGAISNYIDRQFGSQGDELKETLGDMVKDESPSIRSTSKRQNLLKKGDIDGVIDDLDSEGNRVAGAIDQLDIPPNDRAVLKRYWTTLWIKKQTFYDYLKTKAVLAGEDAAQLLAYSDDEIEELIKTSANAKYTVKDLELLKAYRAAMSQTAWKSLPRWVRGLLIAAILSDGDVLTIGKMLMSIVLGYLNIGTDRLEELEDAAGINMSGGVNKLKEENKNKILQSIYKDNSSLFDSTGALLPQYEINYYTDGSKLEILDKDDSFRLVAEYSIEDINKNLQEN